jgi:hypothetical protein
MLRLPACSRARHCNGSRAALPPAYDGDPPRQLARRWNLEGEKHVATGVNGARVPDFLIGGLGANSRLLALTRPVRYLPLG